MFLGRTLRKEKEKKGIRKRRKTKQNKTRLKKFQHRKHRIESVRKTKRVTLVYLYHVNRCGHHKKLSIAKLDFVQVCGLSLNFYSNTLRKFYKFSDSRET